MNLRDFRIGWRQLVKEPAYSAVVILGLAIGFAVCFLLLGLVRHSLSYDSQVPDSGNIYRIKQRWNNPGSDGSWINSLSLPARDAIAGSGICSIQIGVGFLLTRCCITCTWALSGMPLL